MLSEALRKKHGRRPSSESRCALPSFQCAATGRLRPQWSPASFRVGLFTQKTRTVYTENTVFIMAQRTVTEIASDAVKMSIDEFRQLVNEYVADRGLSRDDAIDGLVLFFTSDDRSLSDQVAERLGRERDQARCMINYVQDAIKQPVEKLRASLHQDGDHETLLRALIAQSFEISLERAATLLEMIRNIGT